MNVFGAASLEGRDCGDDGGADGVRGVEDVRKKKRKIPAPIFIAPSGNGRTTARFSERRTVTAPWNSVAPLWPCVPNTCWAIELEAVARILCAGQRRKREDAVVWSNALEYPENPDDMLSVACQIRDPDYGALRRDSLPSVPGNPETRLYNM